MEISRDAYRAIEDIVGPENVTDDPAFLDSYAFECWPELVRPNRSHYMPRPWAVVMPASTEEVQAVTKVCNKYKIKIKPISTGWYHWAAPLKDNEPDGPVRPRRMNRILDIDEKNRFAIVEPYVICAQLQAEAMKRGLNFNIIGAGSSTSVVAERLRLFRRRPVELLHGRQLRQSARPGMGDPGRKDRSHRLAQLRLPAGSARKAPVPACAPSPAAYLGSRGGLGTFTKCAIKLSHWPGPTGTGSQGPSAGLSAADPRELPRLHHRRAGLGRLGELLLRDLRQRHRLHLPPAVQLGRRRSRDRVVADLHRPHQDPRTTSRPPPRIRRSKGHQEKARISFQFIMAAQLDRRHQLQDKILDAILAQTGCYKVERYCEQDMAEFTNMYMQRLGHKHCNFIWVGGYMGSWMQAGTPDFVKGYAPVAIEGFERDQKSHLLVECGGDALMGRGSTIGGGG